MCKGKWHFIRRPHFLQHTGSQILKFVDDSGIPQSSMVSDNSPAVSEFANCKTKKMVTNFGKISLDISPGKQNCSQPN